MPCFTILSTKYIVVSLLVNGTEKSFKGFMTGMKKDYILFYKFIEAYAPTGYRGINPGDPLMVELEEMMEDSGQFFYVGDLIQMNVVYTSKRSTKMIGVEPEKVTPYDFFKITHPDDIYRLSLGRAKLFKMAYDLFKAEKGFSILSTNFLMQSPKGGYSNFLIQLYLFFSTVPYKSVFTLKIHTDIDWYHLPKNSFHYYVGNDISNFRYPDEKLLQLTFPFSLREFEIIRFIESGLTSGEIAEKLFLSIHTVNTHRRNILSKVGKNTMSELIYDLMERGVL
jgi:DNA-binding CsgD family transcriptional regulator